MRNNFSSFVRLTLGLGIFLGLSACKHEKPNVIYMPDMVYSPAIKAQQFESIRMPVKGTVARDSQPYHFWKDPEGASHLVNPLAPKKAVMERGKRQYDIYCAVCHGANGDGGAPITQNGFPTPPGVRTEKIVKWTDGTLFHQITVGANLMPSYASQISPPDRWAIVHYVRALQKAKYPTPEDLKIAQQESK